MNHSQLTDESFEEVPEETLTQRWLDLPTTSPFNLLQGPYRPPAQHGSSWRSMLAAASLSTIALLAYLLFAGGYFQHHADLKYQEAEGLYRTLFPGEQRIVDIRKQMQAKLRGAQSSADQTFFELISGIAGTTAQLERKVTPRRLQYSHGSGVLITEVQAASMNDATALRDELARRNLTADIRSVTKNDAGVIARLEVGLP